jgi:hypothetical protein
MAVSYLTITPKVGESYTTSVDATSGVPWPVTRGLPLGRTQVGTATSISTEIGTRSDRP